MKSPLLSRRFTLAHEELLPAATAGWGLKGIPPFRTSIILHFAEVCIHRCRAYLINSEYITTANKPHLDRITTSKEPQINRI